jgi:uncharacterized protein (TIGR03084 family)
MDIFDDLEDEQDRLDAILDGLGDAEWTAPSGAPGWTVADVVLHLAQTDEAVVTSAAGGDPAQHWAIRTGTLDGVMDAIVRAQRAEPAIVFQRWRTARRAALIALRGAAPERSLRWTAAPVRPTTLATTRLAEHWAHGLDITEPLGIPLPDTARLRHVAWLGHRSLAYAFALAGEEPHEVFCELRAPDGGTWQYGAPDAASTITGPAAAFCRVGAHRLEPEASALVARGPHGLAALRLLRNYAA